MISWVGVSDHVDGADYGDGDDREDEEDKDMYVDSVNRIIDKDCH